MLRHTRIYVFRAGSIPSSFVDTVLTTLRSFYNSLRNIPVPELVEVYVYSTSYEKTVFLESEARSLGVIVIGDFITVHEAWRGWPRIHVDYEKCRPLKQDYVEALLLHEAAHSVLHGSPIYYLLDIDKQLLDYLGFEYAVKTTYLASTVVKDLEVHELLVERGYKGYVEKYLEFLITTQLKDAKCDNILGTLELMKILTPCIFLGDKCMSIEGILHKDCRSLTNKAVKILEESIKAHRHLGLSQRTGMLARKTLELVRSTAK